MQLLQGFDHTAAWLIHGFDTAGCCLGRSDGGDIRHFLLNGSLAQITVIVGSVRADGGIDHQIHLAVDDHIMDIRSCFSPLIDKLRKDSRIGEDLLGTLGGQKPETGSLKGYLFKDEKKNRVFVSDKPQPGAKTCQTNYVVLASKKGLSLVECELITGRTHQIRAQFAHAGHPLLGDGKYGKLKEDKKLGFNKQALYSYSLKFQFKTDAGILNYLNGKRFCVKEVWFADKLFGDDYKALFL